ncbi:MAG TPA: NAD(P)H-dependent oxidoreductase [Rickettsiales bacterium]|nr:NAD(P)H-dependent oxidoreductase [Rickettsiales bacterium]
MSGFKLAIIVGCSRKESPNHKMAKALVKLGADKFEAQMLSINDLPPYHHADNTNFPIEAMRIKKEITNADAVLIVTPEYGTTVQSALRNAIDWAGCSYNQNAFAGKPVAICGTSGGGTGVEAKHSLRQLLKRLKGVLMEQPELYLRGKDAMIDSEGNVAGEGTKQFLQGFIDRYVHWVKTINYPPSRRMGGRF